MAELPCPAIFHLLKHHRVLQQFRLHHNIGIGLFRTAVFSLLRTDELRVKHDGVLRQIELPDGYAVASRLLLPVTLDDVKPLAVAVGQLKGSGLLFPDNILKLLPPLSLSTSRSPPPCLASS